MLASVRLLSVIFLLCTVALCGHSEAQNPKLEGLLRRAPSPANSVCYVHVPSLKKLLGEANIPTNMSDNVEEVYLVSELDVGSMAPTWEAGYATLDKSFDPDSLAKAMGGYVDTIGDRKVVWTPRQSYLVPGGEKRVGFLRPARRTLVAEWLESAVQNPIPAYLDAQAKQPEQFLSLLLAINLKDSFSPVAMASRAKEFDELKGKDPQAIGNLFASVKGVSIIVGRRSLSECILTVEFGQSPADLSSVASVLLNEILNRHGTAAPEVLSWKVSVDGDKLSFKGPISADTLDGLLGIFSMQGHAEQVSEAVAAKSLPTPPSVTSVTQMGPSTKEYFDKVNAFIERVRKYKAQNTGYRAKWNSQQANRIDEIPTLNVDPLMIDYGSNISGMLRGNAASITAGNVSTGQAIAGTVLNSGVADGYGNGYGGYYGGGYYGSYGYGSGVAGRVQLHDHVNTQMVMSTQQRAEGFGSYKQILAQIDQLTGQVRKSMTAKYQIQF